MYYLTRSGESAPCITLNTDDMYAILAALAALQNKQTCGSSSAKHLENLATAFAANI